MYSGGTEDKPERATWQLDGLDAKPMSQNTPHIAIHSIAKGAGEHSTGVPPLTPVQMKMRDEMPYNAVVTLGPSVVASTLLDAEDEEEGASEDKEEGPPTIDEKLLAVCVFSSTHAQVDVNACTDSSVLLLSTRGAGSTLVAEGVVCLMLALFKGFNEKECSSTWSHDAASAAEAWPLRFGVPSFSMRGKVLGLVGFDGVAREVLMRLKAFGISKCFVFTAVDASAEEDEELKGKTLTEKLIATNTDFAAAKGELPECFRLEAVGLKDLLRASDIVSIHCTANDRGCYSLIDLDLLALMQPSAVLVNAASGGGVVDEEGLYVALHDKALRAAAVDCFAQQPPSVETMERFAELENVIVTEGNIAACSELHEEMGQCLWNALGQLASGDVPDAAYIVNPEVLKHPKFKEKWSEVLSRLPTSCIRAKSPAAASPGKVSAHSTPRRVGASIGSRSNTPRKGAGAGGL